MKKIIFSILPLILLISCSQKEEKFTLKNPEIFSFYVEDSWEITATVFAENFAKEKADDTYNTNIFYEVDIVTPAGDTIKQIDLGTIEEVTADESDEVKIESQIALGSNFNEGKYKLIFDVKDLISNQEAKAVKEFELKKEE